MTLEELYEKTLSDDELKKAFRGAKSDEKIEKFMEENGCTASVEEALGFLESKKFGELADDELDAVGGCLCGCDSNDSNDSNDEPNLDKYRKLDSNQPCEHWFCRYCNSMHDWEKCDPWDVQYGCPGCKHYYDYHTHGYCVYPDIGWLI